MFIASFKRPTKAEMTARNTKDISNCSGNVL